MKFSGTIGPLLTQGLMIFTDMNRIYGLLQILKVNWRSINENNTYQNRPQSSHKYDYIVTDNGCRFTVTLTVLNTVAYLL